MHFSSPGRRLSRFYGFTAFTLKWEEMDATVLYPHSPEILPYFPPKIVTASVTRYFLSAGLEVAKLAHGRWKADRLPRHWDWCLFRACATTARHGSAAWSPARP